MAFMKNEGEEIGLRLSQGGRDQVLLAVSVARERSCATIGYGSRVNINDGAKAEHLPFTLPQGAHRAICLPSTEFPTLTADFAGACPQRLMDLVGRFA